MQLSNLRTKLYHENCWTSELSNMFPDGNLVVPFSRKIVNEVTVTYALTKTSKAQAKSIIHSEKFSRFYPRIVGTLGNVSHNQIFLLSFQFKSDNSIYRRMRNIEEVVPIQVTYENEYEIWNFLIPTSGPRNYKKLILGELEQAAEIEGHSFEDGHMVLRGNIDNYLGLMLPPSTMFMLQQLMGIGYFDFPRKISIDGAASQLGISKGFISKVSRKIFEVLRPDYSDNEKNM